jgi:hypothetical protein
MTYDPKKPTVVVYGNKTYQGRVLATDLEGIYPIAVSFDVNEHSATGRRVYASVATFDSQGKTSTSLMWLDNVVEKTSKFRPLWANCLIRRNEYSEKTTFEGAMKCAKLGTIDSSPALGVVEDKYEDGKYVGSEFHAYKEE